MAHSPDWPVVSQTVLQRERWPGYLRGYRQVTSLVRPGQEVLPDQPIIRLERETMAGPTRAAPVTLPAGLRGRVVDVTHRGGVVIESYGALLQGALGAGRQVAGVLTIWQEPARASSPPVIPPGALLVVPGPLNFSLLRQAQRSGVAGIIASSIALSDLEGFLRTDFIQLLETPDVELAQSRLPDLTLLLTEGLGTITMPTAGSNFLNRYRGSIALLSGITSQRYHIVPELIISFPAQQQRDPSQILPSDLMLTLGAQVRVCAGEYIGFIGLIDYFFVYEQVFPSGIHARALRIRREDGSFIKVPVTHVKRIG
ncbi:MAG TPA: hypothetical protein VL485_11450 [Ktedonobacteraceae bacterium]|jgi:hypothetical protein|nr:hypothetical protein [Ktedonobacteraceae bacterium]